MQEQVDPLPLAEKPRKGQHAMQKHEAVAVDPSSLASEPCEGQLASRKCKADADDLSNLHVVTKPKSNRRR